MKEKKRRKKEFNYLEFLKEMSPLECSEKEYAQSPCKLSTVIYEGWEFNTHLVDEPSSGEGVPRMSPPRRNFALGGYFEPPQPDFDFLVEYIKQKSKKKGVMIR